MLKKVKNDTVKNKKNDIFEPSMKQKLHLIKEGNFLFYIEKNIFIHPKEGVIK